MANATEESSMCENYFQILKVDFRIDFLSYSTDFLDLLERDLMLFNPKAGKRFLHITDIF